MQQCVSSSRMNNNVKNRAKPHVQQRVCVIGGGPSGMSVLYHLEKYRSRQDENSHIIPDVVCYEKQENTGGLWNFDWKTGMELGIKKIRTETQKYEYNKHVTCVNVA